MRLNKEQRLKIAIALLLLIFMTFIYVLIWNSNKYYCSILIWLTLFVLLLGYFVVSLHWEKKKENRNKEKKILRIILGVTAMIALMAQLRVSSLNDSYRAAYTDFKSDYSELEYLSMSSSWDEDELKDVQHYRKSISKNYVAMRESDTGKFSNLTKVTRSYKKIMLDTEDAE